MRLRVLMPPPLVKHGAIKLLSEEHARGLSEPVSVRQVPLPNRSTCHCNRVVSKKIVTYAINARALPPYTQQVERIAYQKKATARRGGCTHIANRLKIGECIVGTRVMCDQFRL